MENEIKSNSVVFAGPFMGEFGWELSHWVPHVRWLRNQYKGKQLIVSSYPGREPLYHGMANEFWPLPDWFVSLKQDVDSFESLSPSGSHYGDLILQFKNKLLERFKVENVLWTKTPRGFNHVLRNMDQVVFKKIEASAEAQKTADELISDNGGKPVIILFARDVKRRMFLDIINNKAEFVEDCYPEGLPTRNWPRSHWQDLFEMLYGRFKNRFTFAIGGTKSGNCLIEAAQIYGDVIDLTEFDITKSLDVTIAILNKAFLSISSQSGPTHLSVQCGCPSFIYGHELERHTQSDNPLRTDVVFYPTQLGLYNDSPEQLFKEITVYIELLKQEKTITPTEFVNAKGETFEYSPKSYAAKSEDWIKNVVSEQALLDKWADPWHQGYINRWKHWFSDIEMGGRILDIGFQNGKTLYQLSQKYPYAKIDAVDFNPALSNAIPFYKKLMPNLYDIWIGDCQKINKMGEYYECIHCVDFFEHLPQDVYERTIKECYRLLKPNGLMFVYVGKTDAHAHIHLVSNETVIKDMSAAGFQFFTNISDLLVFEKVPVDNSKDIIDLLRQPAKPKAKKIKNIGMVGVFDNPDSTNIPFAKAFERAGCRISVFNYRTVAEKVGYDEMNLELVRFADEFDLIIICKGNGISADTIKECANKTTVCFYMMDAKCHFDNDATYYDMAKAADFNIVTSGEVANALESNGIGHTHHIIQGIDPTQFRAIETEEICDIVFIGQATPKRMKILTELAAGGITGRAYGPGFPAGFCNNEKFNVACSEGRILLAINNTDSIQDSFSDRILRYMATGGCVVTEYSNGLEKYFENGKHCAWPVGDQTLIDVFWKYLGHPKMMDQMAKNGYEYVIENHTWNSVAKKIINIAEGL